MTVALPLEPLLPDVLPDVAEGDAPLTVLVEDEDETKGLESEEIAAAVRSKSNWRVLET